MSIIRGFVLSLLTCFAGISSAACGKIDNNQQTTILFVNGIFNADDVACASMSELSKTLRSEGIDISKVNFAYFHNPNSWRDASELRLQADLSNDALSLANGSREEYYFQLGKIYKTSIASNPSHRIFGPTKDLYNNVRTMLGGGRHVLVVPHSQGNFIIEAVYAMLIFESRTDPGAALLLDRIRVVGVAPVSYSSPSGAYISNNSDRALAGMRFRNNNIYFSVLPGNTAPCIAAFCGDDISWVGYGDGTGHGFVEVYLSKVVADSSSQISFSRMVSAMVQSAMDELALRFTLKYSKTIGADTRLLSLRSDQFKNGTGTNDFNFLEFQVAPKIFERVPLNDLTIEYSIGRRCGNVWFLPIYNGALSSAEIDTVIFATGDGIRRNSDGVDNTKLVYINPGRYKFRFTRVAPGIYSYSVDETSTNGFLRNGTLTFSSDAFVSELTFWAFSDNSDVNKNCLLSGVSLTQGGKRLF